MHLSTKKNIEKVSYALKNTFYYNIKQATLFLVFLFAASIGIDAQNVGINTTGATPSANAILDLNSGNNYNLGLIIPHVTLGASLATFNPPIANAVSTKDTGMIVYNMNGPQAVGYYYWNGSTWVNVSGAGGGSGSSYVKDSAWLLTGNAGTTPGTNFLGTTDSAALEFKVHNNKAGYIDYAAKANTFFGYQAGNVNTGTYNIGI